MYGKLLYNAGFTLEMHAPCMQAACSMLHPAYRRNAGRITPVCRHHTLVCSLHTSVWRLHTLVLQPSCRDACSLHAACMPP